MKKNLTIILLIAAGAIAFSLRVSAADEPWQNMPFMDYKLTPEQRAADLVSRLTLEEKVSLLSETAEAIPRLGVMKYYHGNEALHGVVRPGNFTVFPMAIALAATWDPDLIHEVATAISDEARGKNNANNREITDRYSGLLTFWSPTVNMARDPRWGRTPETYGEDPYLTGQIGVNFVRGLQGDDPKYIKVVSTPKHFAANNEDHNRDSCNAIIPERSLREYYLPAYKTLIQEGNAQSIMGAYNAINGVPCNANKMLLTDILRDEWGFDGYVVTDCGALGNLIRAHKYAKDGKEAAAFALNAGVDLECGGDAIMKNRLVAALKDGLVTEKAIDQAAYRVLRGRFRLGMFDPPEMVPYNKIPGSVVGSKEHQALALKTGQESIVLLKNDPVGGAKLLPLDMSKIKTIALVGPNAAIARFGDYSGSPVNPAVTPLDGIKDRAAGRVTINYSPWISAPSQNELVAIPSEFLKPSGGEGGGLKAEYFANGKLSGAPAASRVDIAADVDTEVHPPDPAIPRGTFSVRWTAKLTPALSGQYTFGASFQGGVRLLLDGKPIIDRKPEAKGKLSAGKSFNIEAAIPKKETLTAQAALEAGKEYEIQFEYFYSQGPALAKLLWIAPTVEKAAAREKELAMAEKSDVVIAVMGIGLDQEREGIDRADLNLPADQEEYLKLLITRNPRTIIALVSGSPLSINWEAANAPAIVETWYGGEQGGNAFADVLFGNYNPAGRLPLTFYKSVEELPPFDNYDITRGRTYMYMKNEPIYPFGHGLSYTSFEYSNISIDKPKAAEADTVNVSFEVKNTGPREGDDVPQLYTHAVQSSVPQPNIKLHGFKRVHLEKGETQKVTIPVAIKELGFWDADSRKFKTEPGAVDIMIGSSSRDIRLKSALEVVK